MTHPLAGIAIDRQEVVVGEKDKKKRTPPRRPPPDKEVGRQVWVACRAVHGCEGKTSTIVMRNRLPQGGTATRYHCGTCGRPFYITV